VLLGEFNDEREGEDCEDELLLLLLLLFLVVVFNLVCVSAAAAVDVVVVVVVVAVDVVLSKVSYVTTAPCLSPVLAHGSRVNESQNFWILLLSPAVTALLQGRALFVRLLLRNHP